MDIFLQLSLLIVIATIIGGVMRIFKQPLIMGYIITGVLVGPYLLNLIKDPQSAEIFSLMGISMLLFIVGLSLSPQEAQDVGKPMLLAAVGQIFFTSVPVFLITRLIGYNNIASIYLALSITFSSTIIILKLLSDKKDLEKFYGRISIGILLVQDLVATIALIIASTFSSRENLLQSSLLVLIKGISATLVLSLVSKYVLPKLANFFARSQEYLLLFAIAWGFGLATIFKYLGFSIEIGALVAGVTLSISPFAHEISTKLRPLRDFFVVMFFIYLGANMDLGGFSQIIVPALGLSAFVILAKPIIVMTLMGILGYNKKSGFLAGITFTQISEFSLILVLLGVKLGHIDKNILSLITLVALITISVSTYLIINSGKLYLVLSKYLTIFERKRVVKEKSIVSNYDVILFGCNRVGYDFVKVFKNMGSGFLAVDFDPDVISDLQKKGINCEYGDAEDPEFLDEINITSAKLVISTIPDFDTNRFLLEKIRKHSQSSGVVVISYSIEDALEFYELGATYVILPHFIGGSYAADLAYSSNLDSGVLGKHRDEHINYLKERKSLGHSHPVWGHHF